MPALHRPQRTAFFTLAKMPSATRLAPTMAIATKVQALGATPTLAPTKSIKAIAAETETNAHQAIA